MQDYRKLAEAQIAAGKSLAVVEKSLVKYFLAEDSKAFYAQERSDYGVLFPVSRDMILVEYNADMLAKDATYVDILQADYDLVVDKPQVGIDYSGDASYVTYDEYINETQVVTPAVDYTFLEYKAISYYYGITETEYLVSPVMSAPALMYTYEEYVLIDTSITVESYALSPVEKTAATYYTYVEYGEINPGILAVEADYPAAPVEKTAEVTELVRPYILPAQPDTDVLVTGYLDASTTYAKLTRKLRDEEVSKLTVTVSSGKTFDADEVSRQRMADSILASGFLSLTETNWKLVDNTIVLVTLDELREAHALALQAFASTIGVI